MILFLCFRIQAQDTLPPTLVKLPTDAILECGTANVIDSLSNWFLEGGGIIFSDDSGEYTLVANMTLSQAIDIFNSSQDTLCGRSKNLKVIFSAIDSAGNTSLGYECSFSLRDRLPPIIVNGPNVSYSCIEGIQDTLINWIKNKGKFQATDNCSDTLYWTTFIYNIFDKSTGGRISGGRGNIDFGPYPTIPNGICNWGMSINFTVIDECGNSSLTPASIYNFNVTDDVAPRFVITPPDITVSCHDIPLSSIQVRDDCDSNVNIAFTEESTQSTDSLNCGYYNYTLTRTWVATDKCNNSASYSQRLNVVDNQKPTSIYSSEVSISCFDYDNARDTLFIIAQDLCSPVSIQFRDSTNVLGCTSILSRQYILTDICDNKDTIYQRINVVQNQSPRILEEATNIELSCENNLDIIGLLVNWVDSMGGSKAQSLCGEIKSFAAVKGSYNLKDPSTYPGILPKDLSSQVCPSPLNGFLSFVEVDFVYYDTCGNVAVSEAIFGIGDTIKPQILNCRSEYNFTLAEDLCETFVSIPIPNLSDNCQSGSPTIQRVVREEVTSNTPPGPEALVNPLILNIGPFNSKISPPSSDANINIRLINLDIDDATEFFLIFNEDNQQIGVTPTGAGQCADTSMTLTLSIANLTRWLVDDFITLRFEPFIVPGSPVLSINNFCGQSFIESSISYETDLDNVLDVSYSVNKGGFQNSGTHQEIELLLSQGKNSVIFKVRDCAGNEATCETSINILDTRPPEIQCPTNITSVLKNGLCLDTIPLSIDFKVEDNCNGNRPYNQISPISREASLISFELNSSTQKLTARDKQIIFNNVFPIRHGDYDVDLIVEFFGNNTQIGQQFQILGPDGTLVGTTEWVQNSPTDCALSTTHFRIPFNVFNGWISNRRVNFLAKAINSAIEPCGSISAGSSNDNLSYITGRLRYSDVMFSISSSGGTIINKTPIPVDLPNYNLVLNQGKNDITLHTQDAAGNEGTCVFEVNIVDEEKPVAICKNATLTVDPSGLISTPIDATLIDGGSFDNCGIIEYEVDPSLLDCALAGTDVPLKLTVTDVSGNTHSCSTTIRALAYEVKPTFSSGLCANDTLKLFANVPPSSVPGTYTFHWVGPRAGIEFFTENPTIPNADPTYNGVYVLTVKGFNECVSIGSVSVNINPITNPILTTNRVEICQGEEFVLSTTRYSDEVNYEWYSGIFPTGVLLSVTSIPEYVVKPSETGPLFYYVIASGPDCKSSPSALVRVNVNQRPLALVNESFISLCEGETIVLGTSVIGSGFQYRWTGPNGYMETGRNPRVIPNAAFATSGNYQLVIDNKGCLSDTAVTRVSILERPQPPIIVGNDIFCEGALFSLVASGVSNVDFFEWYLNGRLFTTTQQNSLVIPNTIEALQGNWTVKVIKGSCESAFSQGKAVAIDLALQVGISSPGAICAGDSITLQATFVPNASYTWQGPTPDIPSVFNPRILAMPGDYSVTITTVTGCQNNANTVVSVISVPEITALSADVSDCMEVGDSIQLSPSVFPNLGSYTFQWRGPDNFVSESRNPLITPLKPQNNGIYQLTVFNQGCASVAFEKEVIFTLKPQKPSITFESPICQGEDLKVFVQNEVKADNYNWSTPTQGQNTTLIDTLEILQASNLQNGFYTLVIEENGCFSEPSDSLLVLVTPRPAPLPVFGEKMICYGDTIRVSTQNVNGINYLWQGPNFSSQSRVGFTIAPATNQNSGLYSLFVEKDGCLSSQSSDILIQVLEEIKVPNIENNVINLCYDGSSGVEICIEPESLEVGGEYSLWLDNQILQTTKSGCLFLTDLSLLREGFNTLKVRTQIGNCYSGFSNDLFLTLNRPPDVEAKAMENDVIICPDDEVRLLSLSGPPLVRINWISPDADISIIPQDGRNPFVSGLKPGENIIYLSYSVSGCPDFTIDTVRIFQEFLPVAKDDQYTVNYGETTELKILENDVFPENSRITIQQFPLAGTAIFLDSLIQYTPDLRNIQPQTITYSICSDFCENLCDEATVRIIVDDNIECKTPTIFTPNRDGINDFFIIPCLETGRFPRNKVSIFNEWGSQVHYASPYDNNWEGTYGGNPLPVGTYYYVVELEPGRSPINGFLILQR